MKIPPPKTNPGLPLARSPSLRRQPAGFLPFDPVPAAAGELLTDDGEGHLLLVAPTGAGKGVSGVIPWLLSHPGGLVVVDPKGEAAAITARERLRRGQRVCIVDPFQVVELPPGIERRDTLNPLELFVHGSDDLGDECLSLAELVAGEAPGSLQDPFWRQNALDLLAALLGWIHVRSRVTGTSAPDDGTLRGVWNLLHAEDPVYGMAVLMDTHAKKPEMPEFVRHGFTNFLQHEGEKVRTSVRSEAVSLMRNFGSPRIQQASAATSVPLSMLRDGGPVTLYLVLPPDRLDSHAQWLRVTLGAVLGLISRRRVRPAHPTLFVIDELGHLGPLPQLKQAVTLLRGYGVRLALVLQSLAQMKGLWPKDHESVLENCGVWLNFGNHTMTAARQVADQLGDIGADALFGMSANEMALHRAGQATQIVQRLDYRTDPLFRGRFDANPRFSKDRPI